MLRTVTIARRIDHRYYRVLGRQWRGWDRGHSDQVRAGASKRPHPATCQEPQPSAAKFYYQAKDEEEGACNGRTLKQIRVYPKLVCNFAQSPISGPDQNRLIEDGAAYELKIDDAR